MSEKTIALPTSVDLESEFQFLKKSSFQNVNGVFFIDSGKPGPTLGVTINTHGNEPSGLATFWHFRNHMLNTKNIKIGKVFFVLNNIQATEKYFTATKIEKESDREEQKRKSRLCELNFNRLPENALELRDDPRSEIRRAQELAPVWSKFDIGFDIHSTTKKSPPMIVICGEFHQKLVSGFPIETIVSNIDKVQIDKPAISFYGKTNSMPCIAIEAGSHEDSSSFTTSIACFIALMQNTGIWGTKSSSPQRNCVEYYIEDSLMFPNESYELVKVFETFEPVKQGQVLAIGNKGTIEARFDGHALFGPPKTKPDFINEEVLFLSRQSKSFKI